MNTDDTDGNRRKQRAKTIWRAGRAGGNEQEGTEVAERQGTEGNEEEKVGTPGGGEGKATSHG